MNHMEDNERYPRHWLLIAERDAGKSKFGAAMAPEYLVCDFDGRWKEQEKTAGGRSYRITESDALKVIAEMKKLYPQIHQYVKTIIYDSGTAVLDFIQAKGRLMDAEAKENKTKFNTDDINRQKADTMRALRLAALQWHCDVLWIFHIENRQKAGQDKVRTTISKIEMEVMKQSLNAVLSIVRNPQGMRGIRIDWCRFHENAAAGQVVWDLDGMWKNVPEKLDVFLASYTGTEGYKGLAYSDEWLMKYLAEKGVTYADAFEMYKKLDIKDTPAWFDRNSWGAIIKRALPAPEPAAAPAPAVTQ
jgi:hypothetical protein